MQIRSKPNPRLRHHLRLARAFFFTGFAAASLPTPPMLKSSSFLPDLSAAASHRGFSPRPAQVSPGFSGFRYFGATFPRAPRPKADFAREPPDSKRVSLASSDSRLRRSSETLDPNIASILPRRPTSASIDIDFKFIFILLRLKRLPALYRSDRKCKPRSATSCVRSTRTFRDCLPPTAVKPMPPGYACGHDVW